MAISCRLHVMINSRIHIIDVPGGYNEKVDHLIPKVADVVWFRGHTSCRGWNVHGICIVSSGDLHRLKYKVDLDNIQGPFFHNKYFMERDHAVMDCLEEQLVIRNKEEYKKECIAI